MLTMNKQVANPPIPFVMTIPEGPLQAGHVILLQGNPLTYANRFCFNLVRQSDMRCVFHIDFRFDQGQTVRNCELPSGWGNEERSHLPVIKGRNFQFTFNVLCGPRPDVADIAFHFDACFDVGRVVRNTKLHHHWGEEENLFTGKFPFKNDVPFSVEMYVSPASFLVAIDGTHFCEFAHRVPINSANTLQIQGDVKITRILFKKENFHPSVPPFTPPSPSGGLNVQNPRLPFAHPITGGVRQGGELFIQGKVKPMVKRFHINLQQGSQTYPHPTIAFHFNPRFDSGAPVIVMNSYIGTWGNEERLTHSVPLKPNMEFALGIKRQSHGYEVSVNGNRVAVFSHRVNADVVDTVAIDGDVVIHRAMLL